MYLIWAVSIPYVLWEIDFGLIDHELKNYLENMLINEESISLITQVGPSFSLVYEETDNILSYVYPQETKFYGEHKFDVLRALNFSKNSGIINYEGIEFNINNQLSMPRNIKLSHRVQFMFNSISVSHRANGLVTMRASFKEYMQPIDRVFNTIGVSSASNSFIC